MELKWNSVPSTKIAPFGSNRTFMELKLGKAQEIYETVKF